MGRVTGAGMHLSGVGARLVVPEGLMIDESARDRLERQLAVAPDSVVGVGAETAPLAPGASYRVHAEWLALETASDPVPAAAAVRGSVLVRPGVDFTVRAGRVEVARGTVTVDPGAHTHDPHAALGAPEIASERGRPPFPRRPVVVFLGVETPASDWLVKLVNRLVRRDVEARVAAPAVPAGLHLTRPCRPDEASIRALAPDVVVTVDDAAAAVVDAWCEGDRATVVVRYEAALRDPMELVSWQIGHASGRLRARIGRRVEVPAFASLIGRLCAGPQPMPPVDRPAGTETKLVVRERWTSRGADAARTDCVVVAGVLDAAAAARVDGLADALDAAGVPVVVARVGASAISASARDAAVLMLAGVAPTPDVDALVARRREAGRPTVLDVGVAEVALDGEPGALTAPAAALAAACGLVTAPGGARTTAARAAAVRSLLLPTLLTRARAAALRDAHGLARSGSGSGLVIGWRCAAPVPYAAAVGDGIAAILAKRPDQLEFVGAADLLPAALRDHPRVTVMRDDAFEPDTLVGWALNVWTPALRADEILDDARLFDEAGCVGVASILPAAAATGVDGFVSPHVQVQSPERAEEWTNALHHVLDDPAVREQRASEARRRADALDGLAAAKAVVSRFMGWAQHRAAPVTRVAS